MRQSVIFIEGKPSFINQAIVDKLVSAGFEVYRVADEADDIARYRREADLMLYYPAGSDTHIDLVMQYMAELCICDQKLLSLIGDAAGVGTAKGYWDDRRIVHTYVRPIDVNHIVQDMLELALKHEEYIRTKNILLVDDDDDFLALMRRWLRDSYKVDTVRSGIEALRYLQDIHPDLILLDYEMPGLNGFGLMELIHEDPSIYDIPIIFLTGKNDRSSVLHIIKNKPDGYLLKSMKKEELMDTLERFFTDSILPSKKQSTILNGF